MPPWSWSGAAKPQWRRSTGWGSGLTQYPTYNYVDDVTISLGRMPLWSAGMETGDLSEWGNGATGGDNTPGDGYAITTAVQLANEQGVLARTSTLFNKPSVWAMKQSWIKDPCNPPCSPGFEACGTRMTRYKEVDTLCKAGTTFYYSWWDFFPAPLAFIAGVPGWFNHWQIMSYDSSNNPVPVWVLGINVGSDGSMMPGLTWNPTGSNSLPTPQQDYFSTGRIPVGQWNFFEVGIRPRSDSTGALTVWLNGTVLSDLSISGKQTQFQLNSPPNPPQPLLTKMTNNAYAYAIRPPFPSCTTWMT